MVCPPFGYIFCRGYPACVVLKGNQKDNHHCGSPLRKTQLLAHLENVLRAWMATRVKAWFSLRGLADSPLGHLNHLQFPQMGVVCACLFSSHSTQHRMCQRTPQIKLDGPAQRVALRTL